MNENCLPIRGRASVDSTFSAAPSALVPMAPMPLAQFFVREPQPSDDLTATLFLSACYAIPIVMSHDAATLRDNTGRVVAVSAALLFRVNRFAPVTNRFAHWRPELWSDSRKLQFLSETSWHAGCRFCCEAQGTGKKTQRIELNFMNALIPPSDSSVHGIRTSASISPPTFSRNGKILIVDDNEDARFLHSRVLSGAGYETDEAANGEEAWMMIFTTSYDLILTDYNMPHLNGLELVARMRASAMTVPVVLVSGALDLGRACDYPGLHLNAIVQKSFECGNVLDAVRRVLPTLLNETTPYSPKDALFRGHPAPTHPVLPQFN